MKEIKTKKTNKFMLILWPIIYATLVIAIIVSVCMVFHNNYFEQIYVSGSSMYPTLNAKDRLDNDNSRHDFGIVDPHKRTIDKMKRFSIITTFYPEDYNAQGNLKDYSYLKIKRVYAFPLETFKFEDNIFYIYPDAILSSKDEDGKTIYYVETGNLGVPVQVEYTFQRNGIDFGTKGSLVNYSKEITTLQKDEYWIMGDNWYTANSSKDSKQIGPINRNMIDGVLVAIEGTAKTKDTYVTDADGAASKNTKLVDKKYIWPIVF